MYYHVLLYHYYFEEKFDNPLFEWTFLPLAESSEPSGLFHTIYLVAEPEYQYPYFSLNVLMWGWKFT